MLDYEPKTLKAVTYFGLVIPLVMIFLDTPQLPDYLRFSYVLGRVLTAFICLVIIVQIHFKKYRQWHLPGFLLTIAAYSIHGQYYFPCYYLAYMEAVIPIGIFFMAPKKVFYPSMGVSAAGMITMIFLSPASVYETTNLAAISKFHFDATAGVLITTLLSFVGYNFVSITRKQKDALAEKFLDIGCHSSLILHDFKNLLTSPINAIFLLKRLENNDNNKKLIEILYRDSKFLLAYIEEINRLSKPYNTTENFKLSEILESLKIILRSQLQGAEIVLEKDSVVVGNKNLITKILYNLIINAVEIKASRIEIGIKDSCLFIRDNGNGFQKEQIQKLNSGKWIQTTKAQGNSIGLFLIQNLVEARGQKMKFANHPEGGAIIKITTGPLLFQVSETDN
jgi:hypothetical protein